MKGLSEAAADTGSICCLRNNSRYGPGRLARTSGPKKLPEIGRTIGRALAEFRRASNELKGQLENEMRLLEADEREKKIVPPAPPPEATVASSVGSTAPETHDLTAAAAGELAATAHADDPPPHPGPGVESA